MSHQKSIGILGAGKVATELAEGLHRAGYRVFIGIHERIETEAWTGPEVSFMPQISVIEKASIIINATPGESSLERLGMFKEELKGKILIDVTNAYRRSHDKQAIELIYPNSSLAEELQKLLPETAVVKTLNTMLAPVMTDPALLKVTPRVFVSGNSTDAKHRVKDLLQQLSWNESSIIDLGDINTARGPEAMFLAVPSIMKANGFRPFAISIAE